MFSWHFLASILVNAAGPYVIYLILHGRLGLAELPSLLATGLPPLLNAVIGIVRHRRVDLLAGLVVFGIALSAVLILFGGSPRLYLVRESLVGGGIACAFLLSLFARRPLGYYFARYFMSGNDPARMDGVDQLWEHAAEFRSAVRLSSAVWGVGLLVEALIRVSLALTLSIETFLAVSPIIQLVIYGGLMAWTVVAGRRRRGPRSADIAAQDEPSLDTQRRRAT